MSKEQITAEQEQWKKIYDRLTKVPARDIWDFVNDGILESEGEFYKALKEISKYGLAENPVTDEQEIRVILANHHKAIAENEVSNYPDVVNDTVKKLAARKHSVTPVDAERDAFISGAALTAHPKIDLHNKETMAGILTAMDNNSEQDVIGAGHSPRDTVNCIPTYEWKLLYAQYRKALNRIADLESAHQKQHTVDAEKISNEAEKAIDHMYCEMDIDNKNERWIALWEEKKAKYIAALSANSKQL